MGFQMLKPSIADPSSQESVYVQLRQDILAGTLPGGTRLKVGDLVNRYASGINPVREALQQLRGEGLVVIEANRGARVRQVDADLVRDIAEIEALVEPFLTAWFVEVATEEDIVELKAVQAEIETLSPEDRDAKSRLDERFHRIIYERHHNRLAVTTWHGHREIIRLIARQYPFSAGRLSQTNEEHRAIIAAISRHDPADAAEWARRHAEMSGRNLVEQMRMAELRRAG
jgi:DNA-binding GntR family transcriptional regulator